MDAEAILSHWKGRELVTWPKRLGSQLQLPDSAINFLVEIGLPREVGRHLAFEAPVTALPRLPLKPSYIQIGSDLEVPLCLDEARGGQVWAYDAADSAINRRLNSSVNQLAAFLVIYDELGLEYVAAPEEQWSSIASRAHARMSAIDPEVLVDPKDYWVLVLEQVQTGML